MNGLYGLCDTAASRAPGIVARRGWLLIARTLRIARRLFGRAGTIRPGSPRRTSPVAPDAHYPARRWPDQIGNPPKRRRTATAHPLPSFLIVGAQKSGTRALFNHVRRHPGALPPLRKEVHYFDFFHERGLDWYRAHFPRLRAGGLAFEATPTTSRIH